ncbi:FAD-dependent oxidoreductase [Spirillospora sp. CA-294931]|uniref:FAD-dependent oxidoreductase n=1 Tax=Spirillospora sp. CA-294931 TaxID=3240042 RepID=UPI003D8DEE16
MPQVLVAGAGVIGLSCAVRLAERGHRVDVVTRDLPADTTSSTAAALWYPYLAHPPGRVTAWSTTTYREFTRLAEIPETGVRLLQGTEFLAEPTPTPAWADAVPNFARLDHGWTFTAPTIDMSVYLPWLVARLESLGGRIVQETLDELPTAPVIVNCTGLGARDLIGDTSLTPVRGQVLVLEKTDLTTWWLDASTPDRLCYVIPRLHDTIVGGTSQPGNWSRTPDPETAQEILHRATRAIPSLESARVLAHKVGLRPARPTVRLETEQTSRGLVVHCYGHGGAGVTLSWGCADEVAALL